MSIKHINVAERITCAPLSAFELLQQKLGLSAHAAKITMEEGDGGPVLTFTIQEEGTTHCFYLYGDGDVLTLGHETDWTQRKIK